MSATQRPEPPFDTPQQTTVPGRTGDMKPKPDHGEQSYKGSGRLAGKATIITGGDSGIGRAVAIAFAREGADVLISYLDEDDDARETARWVEQAGRRAVLLRGDITDSAHCDEIVQRAVTAFGKLDVLGPVDNQQVQMKEAEIATNEEKRSDSLSYRVATRRNCLMRQKNRSTRFREAYRCSSKGRCSRRLARLGRTA